MSLPRSIGVVPVYARPTPSAWFLYVSVAGALSVFVYLGASKALTFDVTLSLNLLFMIIIGGIGSILGGFFGAFFIVALRSC